MTFRLSLAAEHLADLKRSGLSDDVIEVLQCEAVYPHDIKIPGVNSAYAIPYFSIAGDRNCFERWRLFPPRSIERWTSTKIPSAGR